MNGGDDGCSRRRGRVWSSSRGCWSCRWPWSPAARAPDHNAFVRIQYEALGGYRVRKGESYVTQKAQWLIGQIPDLIQSKAKLEGFGCETIPAAYTTKKCHCCHQEGSTGFLMHKIGSKYFPINHHLPKFDLKCPIVLIRNSDFFPTPMPVENWQLNTIPRDPARPHIGDLFFYSSKAGHVFHCTNPTCRMKDYLVGRDYNAAINIGQYDPFTNVLDRFRLHWQRLLRANPTVLTTPSSGIVTAAIWGNIPLNNLPLITRHPQKLRFWLKNDLATLTLIFPFKGEPSPPICLKLPPLSGER